MLWNVLLKLLAEFFWTFLTSHVLVVVLLSILMWVLFIFFLFVLLSSFFPHSSGFAPKRPPVSGGRTYRRYSTCLCSLNGVGPVLMGCDDDARLVLGLYFFSSSTHPPFRCWSRCFSLATIHTGCHSETLRNFFPPVLLVLTYTPTISDI